MFHALTSTYTLKNGVEIPCVGFGTWQTPNGETCVRAVSEALRAGYVHIDTAAGYKNEESVGTAIAQSGIARDKLFVTSKLDNNDKGYRQTLAAFEQSLEKLQTDYLDLYLIHWPNPIAFRDRWESVNAETWRAFEELYEKGRIRAIGVSNFRPHHLEALMKTARIAPVVNQIRLCPGETQPETVEYCRAHEILLEAYSPLGTGQVFDNAQIKEMAAKYSRSVAQLCIRWSLQMGFLPLPKSITPSRISENARIFDFELSQPDVETIATLTDCCDPSKDPDTTSF